MFKKYKLLNYNFILLLLVIALMCVGMIVINVVEPSLMQRQGIGAAGAILIIIVISLTDYHILAKISPVLYVINIALLLAVLVAGDTVNNATRWFTIAQVTFQPSELSKQLLIICMANFLGRCMEDKSVNTFKRIVQFLILIGVPLLLIFREPDLSTTLCIFGVMMVMLYAAGLSYKLIGIALLILIPLVSGFIWYIQQPTQTLLYEHQVTRIMSFLYPSEYEDESQQQDNSVTAIGSGHLTGKGLGDDTNLSSDTNTISEQQTDFIFSAIGELFGFIGSSIIVVIILTVVLQCMRTGRKARDPCGMLMATGVGSLIGFQSFINIGVATKLLPNTGIPLPFVSYGLSSLMALAIGVGIVLNVGLQKKKYL